VGSGINPNLEAVTAIKKMADAISREPSAKDKLTFVTAGTCCGPQQGDNFLSLGCVSKEVLDGLYEIADIVIVPLKSGTGSSLKTLEAMAYGKPVLGTIIGFRGYPVETGMQCLIEDDLSRYPEIIIELLSDPERQRLLGEAAFEFASRYDYRTVYKRYAELLQG
jgi:glycosyltransferase involved in cell wall biosynthesis